MGWILREVDDPAGDLGVLVDVLACADAVIAVGDRESDAFRGATAHEQHRRQLLAGSDLLEVATNVDVVSGKRRQPAGAQEILRLALDGLGGPERVYQRRHLLRREEEAQVVGRSGEVMLLRFLLPVRVHGETLPGFGPAGEGSPLKRRPLGEILLEQCVENRVDPLAVLEVRPALPTLPHVAGPFGVRLGALVEGVDLELEPAKVELVEQKSLEDPRRFVRDATASEARVHGDALDPGDPVALARDAEAERAGSLTVDLDHEAAERVRL